ncbi:hypothetical protein J5U22_01889 [Saccharolobus shibatae]|uniref:Uncharacterized protein n=1 Tax=Saccharolobus shibatae TaxID=2286 RepID=A0A8F5H089_9CREN|nr:hypothetical protein J5U22_01889 [Saccharolobus shibatae]
MVRATGVSSKGSGTYRTFQERVEGLDQVIGFKPLPELPWGIHAKLENK